MGFAPPGRQSGKGRDKGDPSAKHTQLQREGAKHRHTHQDSRTEGGATAQQHTTQDSRRWGRSRQEQNRPPYAAKHKHAHSPTTKGHTAARATGNKAHTLGRPPNQQHHPQARPQPAQRKQHQPKKGAETNLHMMLQRRLTEKREVPSKLLALAIFAAAARTMVGNKFRA